MSARISCVAPADDLCDVAAKRLIELHANRLPDLSAVTLLVPHQSVSKRLQQCLVRHAGRGLLGPKIQTLKHFADARGNGPTPLSALECRLIIAAAVRRRAGLFPKMDPLRVATALFDLFEALNRNRVAPPGENEFIDTVTQAYGAPLGEANSREARIAYIFWLMFEDDSGHCSPAATYITDLHDAFAGLTARETVWLIGFDALDGGERAALAACPPAAAAEMRIWLQGERSGRASEAVNLLLRQLGVDAGAVEWLTGEVSSRAAFIATAWNGSADTPAARVRADDGLRIAVADDAEHEARCVELAVRQALLAGCRTVCVISEERRLARRVRALLERADVVLCDEVGWALSTSAAAATLDSWLNAVDTDMHFRPLLDLLKSAFFEGSAAAVRTLERDLVTGAQIESGLARFREKARSRSLITLLDRLARAQALLADRSRRLTGALWVAGIAASLGALGIWEAFGRDPAGERIIGELEALQATLARQPPLDWRDFRRLLDAALESSTFIDKVASDGRPQVRLLTLPQSALLRADTVILAGATRAQIPGSPPGEVFFNQAVRAEIGLGHHAERQALALGRLRRILEAAPNVLITYAPDHHGEAAQPTPWIEALESCAAQQGRSLLDRELPQRAGSAAVEVSVRSAPLPQRSHAPAPVVPSALLPAKISASTHQSLISCPYQFFAGSCLRLGTPEDPDDAPDRSDFGQRIHLMLQAFVATVPDRPDLPPPFGAPVTDANIEAASECLDSIAAAVFARDIENRFVAHFWLQEARSAIPGLIDWMRGRPAATVERTLDQPFGHWTLTGKADRLESGDGGALTLVDYKTGKAPGTEAVVSGEAVQLAHYAMLDHAIGRVEYFSLKDDKGRVPVAPEALAELRDNVGSRLYEVLIAAQAGAPLPANGDDGICAWCDYRGVCRRDDWVEPAPPTAS